MKTAREDDVEGLGLSWSPIRGPEGNIEYLMYLRRLADRQTDLEEGLQPTLSQDADKGGEPSPEEIRELVRKAHETL